MVPLKYWISTLIRGAVIAMRSDNEHEWLERMWTEEEHRWLCVLVGSIDAQSAGGH